MLDEVVRLLVIFNYIQLQDTIISIHTFEAAYGISSINNIFAYQSWGRTPRH